MRKALVMAALLVGACDGGADGADDSTDTDADPAADRVADILALDGDPAAGQQVYATQCTESCHLADGRGEDSPDGSGIGNDLTVVLPDMSDEEVVTIILEGKGLMTGFGSGDFALSDKEIADVVAYIRDAFDGT